MRVLMLTTDYSPQPIGGIGRHAEELTNALRKQGIDITVVTTNRGLNFEERTGIIAAPRTSLIPKPGFSGDDLLITLQDNVLISSWASQLEGEFDVIHSHDFIPSLAADAVSQQRKIPIVTSKHFVTISPRERDDLTNAEKAVREMVINYCKELQQWNLYQSNRIISVSETVKKDILSLYPDLQDRVATIPNGTDIYKKTSQNTPEIIRKTLCNENEFALLLVGRITPKKGGETAIQALKVLQHLPLRLIFVGTGYYQTQLEHLAKELGVSDKVDFKGFIEGSRLVDTYRASDIVLVPSMEEPFGITVSEAMALGKVVIGSNVGGIAEQIEDKKNGVLFTAGNSTELADAIKWVISNPNEAALIEDKARKDALLYRSWDKIAKSTIEQYSLAIEEGFRE